MESNIVIKTKHHENSSNTNIGAEFIFTESGHLILPMKGVNEYVSNDEALRLAKFIIKDSGSQLIASLLNSCDQLRKYLNEIPDEGLKKHNTHYINRIESVVKNLTKY